MNQEYCCFVNPTESSCQEIVVNGDSSFFDFVKQFEDFEKLSHPQLHERFINLLVKDKMIIIFKEHCDFNNHQNHLVRLHYLHRNKKIIMRVMPNLDATFYCVTCKVEEEATYE